MSMLLVLIGSQEISLSPIALCEVIFYEQNKYEKQTKKLKKFKFS
jgi:hypothetical protein